MPSYSQPGIINALDYGMVPNDRTIAVANAQALQAAINAAQANCAAANDASYGATVVIPSNDTVPSGPSKGNGGVYYIAAAPMLTYAVLISCVYPLLITGTSNGTKLVMTGPQGGNYGDVFVVGNNTRNKDENIGGVSFQDLQIFYDTGATSGAAIRITTDSQNVRLFRMVLDSCPVGVALDESLQVSIMDCVIWYSINPGTAVTLGTTTSGQIAKETYIAGCVFESSGSLTGTGLSIINADEVRVVNTRIESFQQGIAITSPVLYCLHLFFENVSVFTYNASESSTLGAALLIQPSGRGSVLRAVFVGCQFGSTENQTNYTGPGIFIDQSNTSGVIDQIRFVSCWSSGWTGNGMQINGNVGNVEILGGYYSCNGQGPFAPTTPIGIYLSSSGSAAPFGVRIVGAACNNSVYSNEGAGGYLPTTQKVGISLPSGAKNVFVRQCDLTGNRTAGLQAASPDKTVQVIDCAGYNDQATPLASTAPPPNQTFYSYTYNNYAGPAAFYVSGGSAVKVIIDGIDTGVSQGGFTLGPGESALLKYSSAPEFTMVGK
ncbi:MAG: hypothetical protein JO030_07855 [Candidatus Eremiobacteraeota bacterium]|nr:hypothetical protein [Candidatus Eremiobacteraeota bacterium]